MLDVMQSVFHPTFNRSESCLFEIRQRGRPNPCYVIVPDTQDLVKSHLMFAVREEVEVLKEKIAELMDRINQLELENTILKAHASQETLAQLSGNNPQQQGNKNQQTQPPSNGSVS
ncbi:TSC22 domain family protein 3 isoform X4 [Anabrus simplex]|uniref:TSC22 domain family protein 3 isoform X4 n=1 Tax=Anabrus simplex TaxID=316456 RepID=UPI0034DDC084